MRKQIAYGILISAVLTGFASNMHGETVWTNPGVAPLFDTVISVGTQAAAAENVVGQAGPLSTGWLVSGVTMGAQSENPADGACNYCEASSNSLSSNITVGGADLIGPAAGTNSNAVSIYSGAWNGSGAQPIPASNLLPAFFAASADTADAPEPGSLAMAGCDAALLIWRWRKQHRHQRSRLLLAMNVAGRRLARRPVA
jgi:hypothetical protein